ncbi:MAG: hypothetical protein LIV29_01345 [Denitrobacterium sp.]|nr:hypothetical protein [Denitrobacterium sp.]
MKGSRFHFSSSVTLRNWGVWRPVLRMGVWRNKYFFYVDLADADKRERIHPDPGLYGKEFLELDHADPFALYAFQRKWGPITGLRLRPNKTFASGTYASIEIDNAFYEAGHNKIFHPDGIRSTDFLFNGYGDADVKAHVLYGTPDTTLKKAMNDNWRHNTRNDGEEDLPVPCHVATVEEVAEAVCDAQVAIRAITDCLRDGFTDAQWEERKRLVRESVRYCNAVLAGAISPLDLVEDEDYEGTCTLMQHLFICMVRGVLLNQAYRNCQNPECGRLFTPSEYGRRADSRYCSPECQVKAKHLRTYKSKKRHQPEKSLEKSVEADSIDISWADRPQIKTLTRENIKTFFGAWASIGLSVGEPRTESYLKELIDEQPTLQARR